MKILSIGNSFSEDAHRWLHAISLVGNQKINTVNLYIGGCTLEKYCECIADKKPDYDYMGNNVERIKKASINEIIENEKFDIITIQQASGFSGKPQSYVPYIFDLVNFIKKHQPNTKIYFHKTWSYEIDSAHGDFKFYNNDQKEMFRRITDCAEMANRLLGIPIIPAGDFIQYLRENTKVFDYRNGGLSLCRDGFHLSEDYGRFAAACVWYKTFTGEIVNAEGFMKENTGFDLEIIDIIVEKLKEFYL